MIWSGSTIVVHDVGVFGELRDTLGAILCKLKAGNWFGRVLYFEDIGVVRHSLMESARFFAEGMGGVS